MLKVSFVCCNTSEVAKQPAKPSGKKPATAASAENSSFGYVLRNLALVVVLGLVLLIVDQKNKKQRELPELTNEFYALRQQGTNQQRLMELYNRIMEIQNDTSFTTRLLRGYNFVVHDVAIAGKETVEKVRAELHSKGLDSTAHSLYEAKMRYKVGTYDFLKNIVNTTPENAVILVPKGDSVISNNSKYNFIYEMEWLEFFIYPRLCINIGDEEKYPDLAKRASHVLILDGRGYEKLKYDIPVEQRPADALLPINELPAGIQTP